MTFKLLAPQTVTDAMLADTNLTEADYAAWNSGTAYALGARCISTTTHKIYESAQAGNTNHDPTVSTNVPTWWLEVGATNRWKPFDSVASDLATGGTTIWYRFKVSGTVNAVSLFGLRSCSIFSIRGANAAIANTNKLPYSEKLNDAGYTKTRITVTEQDSLDPWGSFFGCLVTETASAGTHILTFDSKSFTSAAVYTFSAYVKPGVTGTRNLRFALPSAAFSGAPTMDVTLATGAVTGNGANSSTVASTAVENGWYRVSITATADATTSGTPEIRMLSGASEGYFGVGLAVRVTGVELESGALGVYHWRENAAHGAVTFFEQRAIVLTAWEQVVLEDVVTGLSLAADDILWVSAYYIPIYTTKVLVGEISFGRTFDIGEITSQNPKIVDYSRKTRDDFGVPELVQRNYSKTCDYNLLVPTVNVAFILSFLTDWRAIPAVYFDDEDTASKGGYIFGFWTDMDFPEPAGPAKTAGRITVEGMV